LLNSCTKEISPQEFQPGRSANFAKFFRKTAFFEKKATYDILLMEEILHQLNHGKYHIIYRVSYKSSGAGSLPSTV